MLIYTYKPELHHIPPTITPQQNIDIYRKCIEHNKQFHKIKIYTTQDSIEFFKDIVDEIVVVGDNIDTFFQDDLKFYVLSKEKQNYTLIDGDIILNSKLIFAHNNGIEFEKLVKDNPNDGYFLKMRQFLIDFNIDKEFSYWKNFDFTYNLGIIRVNNNKFVKGFLREYSKLKHLYKKNIHHINPNIKKDHVIEMGTCTYFLSMYLHVNNIPISTLEYTNNFKHYSGHREKLKFLQEYSLIKKQIL